MGRLVRSRAKVQKPDAENISPACSTKKPGRVKVIGKNVDKRETKTVDKKETKTVEKKETKTVDKKETNTVDKKETKTVANTVPDWSSGITSAEDKKPIYLSQKKSLTRKSLRDIEERLHLYDFEVDENEPVVKKSKRKPITKIKKHRTYKKKFKFLPESSIILEDVGKENVHPVTKADVGKENVHPVTKAVTPSKRGSALNPLAEISNIQVEGNLDLSLDEVMHSKRLTLYSPQPYKSPKRDSLIVPVLRTSDCKVDGNTSSHTLNVTANSNKNDRSDCSTYSGSFMNRLFMSSSTPIRTHWSEDSAFPSPRFSPKPEVQHESFNCGNNFGFEENRGIDEPSISPIKYAATPSHNISMKTPTKQSPVRVPFNQVIKMLKFGMDAPESSDGELSFENLPENFFHDGDTPTFSPLPSTPENLSKCQSKFFTTVRKGKNLQFQEDLNDSGHSTQSSEDKEASSKFDLVYNNKRRNKKDKDIGYETEDQVPTTSKRQVRRSYERPVYLRTKKKVTPLGVDVDEDDDNEETISQKTTKKKNRGLSKKEQLEMDKWAKAFNEQCMQIENFNLCVE